MKWENKHEWQTSKNLDEGDSGLFQGTILASLLGHS
jgi:hypothetical protein